jgi:2-keto-3-deoxy-L-rhamnonate aldolase RhmA
MPNSSFENPLRRKLKASESTLGLWVTLEAATVTEIAGEVGVDWVVIDMEHGSLDYRDVLHHLRAARATDLAVLVRVPTNSVEHIKKALDLGAHGVLIPLIRSAAELKEGFKHARYPLIGERGLGGERATRWGLSLTDYVAVADSETMVIPLIETADASAVIDEILAVDGLEAIFYGPADLSQSYGHRAVWEGPGVAQDILRMTDKALAKGIAVGVIGRGEDDIALRQKQGFRMVGIGSDVGLILKELRVNLCKFKGMPLDTRWF